MVRNGRIITPPLSSGALEGITQSSVMTIARDLGFEVVVGDLARSDLYIAEEMFVCGTAAEVALGQLGRRPRHPVPRPDDHAPSPRLHARPSAARSTAYKDWVEHVDDVATTATPRERAYHDTQLTR